MSELPPVTYLDAADILETKTTDAPKYGMQVDGYGKRIPSHRLVFLKNRRWYRVYVACFSNSGSAYVTRDGKNFYLGPEAEERIEQLDRELAAIPSVKVGRL